MVFEKGESTTECDILIEGEKVEQVKEFVYLGSLFTSDGKNQRYRKESECGNKMNRALLAVMNSKSVSRRARLAIHNGVPIPTFTSMYGRESWARAQTKKSRAAAQWGRRGAAAERQLAPGIREHFTAEERQ
ncbi:hypothetical protein EVAR_575_1 [Eumeta japonica]|uniref:Uncharacterized protein n=1 Tax=Eumeta variegata TaxID=151549 RepID=A0A4C1SB56_EUMVA|nr:hypothetical protein EVAR_575_1 [Eumeta japonica]